LDALTDELLGYMGSFEDVVAEGTVDEKRPFLGAFVMQIPFTPPSDGL
jgi:hypothetical protein